MKVLFYLNHPAHYHLFKNTIRKLKESNHKVLIFSKKKDVLDDLLISDGINYTNVLSEGRKDSKLSMINSVLKRGLKLFKIVKKERPDLIIGTAFELAHVGWLLKIPFVSVNEDDADVIPLWSKYSYPFAKQILSPYSCNNGKWNNKTVNYKGYHELAYLHPNNFKPDFGKVKKLLNSDEDFVLIRFAKLNAHHDTGIKGISTEIAQDIIDIIKPRAKVFISSERELEKQFEPYRIKIEPNKIHHVLAFAKLYIGDSQTMAAEAGVLGTPFVRFNDFVGRIGYLNELENKFNLGFGIRTNETDRLYAVVQELIESNNLKSVFSQRKRKMLEEMIDVNEFLYSFITNYPESTIKRR